MIYGPPQQVVNSFDSLNTSTARTSFGLSSLQRTDARPTVEIWRFASGAAKEVGDTRLPYFCDVR